MLDVALMRIMERLDRLERQAERSSVREAPLVNQVGVAVGSVSGPTTTSTSFVDLTDMSVTLTTTGGDLFAIMLMTAHNGTLGQITYSALKLDSGSDVNINDQHTPSADYDNMLGSIAFFTGVSAGSHTVKGRWRVLGGTATVPGTQRVLLVMEVQR
jgi:hypothetical protein